MTRFVLDCTGAQLPDWWKPDWPRVIEIVLGKFEADFDIVDRDFMAVAESAIVGRWERLGGSLNPDVPIGIDISNILVGACIRRLE